MMHQNLKPEPRHEAANYIVYILDGLGKIRGAEWIAARDDADALAQAGRLARSGRCELWQRTRRIARLEGGNPCARQRATLQNGSS